MTSRSFNGNEPTAYKYCRKCALKMEFVLGNVENNYSNSKIKNKMETREVCCIQNMNVYDWTRKIRWEGIHTWVRARASTWLNAWVHGMSNLSGHARARAHTHTHTPQFRVPKIRQAFAIKLSRCYLYAAGYWTVTLTL